MKVTLDPKALAAAVGAVKDAANVTGVPLLACVHLASLPGRIVATCTDLDLTIQADCAGETVTERPIALPARKFHDVVSQLPGGSATLRRDGEALVVTAGRLSVRLLTVAADEFPSIPALPAAMHAVDAAALRGLVELTGYAVGHDDSRAALQGVLLEPTKDGVAAVATDANRLALVERALAPLRDALSAPTLIPGTHLVRAAQVILRDPGEVRIGIAGTMLVLAREDRRVWVRLLEHRFPPYRQILPAERNEVTVDREALHAALKRAVQHRGKSDRALEVTASEGTLALMQVSDLGEYREDMPAEFHGAAIRVGFNPRFLLDAISRIDAEKVVLDLGDELSPGVLRPATDPTQRAVVMPMRLPSAA